MKKLILSALMAFSVLAVSAADGEWLTDLEKAQQQAKSEKKVVLLDFTGSDWCPPCKKLAKDVFSSQEFKDFAKEKLVLVEVDFPAKKKLSDEQKQANDKLKEQFKIEAYPTIVLLDASGKELDRFVGYGGASPEDYIQKLEGAMAKKAS